MKLATIIAIVAMAFSSAVLLTVALEGCALGPRQAQIDPDYPPPTPFEIGAAHDAGRDAR